MECALIHLTVQKNSIRGEGTMAALFPTENMLLGLMEREEGGAEAAQSIWDSHCSDGI